MRRNTCAGGTAYDGFSLNVLSEDSLNKIHLNTLEVLEETGIFVESEMAMDTYEAHGCRVDRDKKIVKIPGYLVEDAIRKAPPRVILCGRDPKNDVVLEGTRVNFVTFGEGIKVNDPYTGLRRPSTKQDIADVAKLVDTLDDLDLIETTLNARDKDERVALFHNADATLNNTTKHYSTGACNAHEAEVIIDMAAHIAGGMDKLRERPFISGGGCPVSPLTMGKGNTEMLMTFAQNGLPCSPLSMAMAGGSSPITLAGTLVVHNAEILSCITLIQMVNPGTPCMYASSTTIMDMRNAIASVGSPEMGMLSAAVVKLAQFYNLPSFVGGT
jgi:trimethylamine--corrinoid protein Co-methyltransferase